MYSLPPSSSVGAPRRTIASPGILNAAGVTWSTDSMTPTMPITRDGDAGAHARIEVDIPGIAVRLHRDRATAAANADHRGVPARRNHRVGAHRRVILPVDPSLAGDRRRRQQSPERPRRIVLLRAG